MRAKLGDIADIHFGPYLKGSERGSYKYLLASHFDEQYHPTLFEESYVDTGEDNLLRQNEVILAGKGQRTFAWAYDTVMGPTVASSLFFILKVRHGEVLSKYLAYYLNSDHIQYKLKLLGSGQTIPSIPKKELQRLDVAIPPLKVQHRLVEVAELMDEDLMLNEQLLKKKKALRNGILTEMIMNKIQLR